MYVCVFSPLITHIACCAKKIVLQILISFVFISETFNNYLFCIKLIYKGDENSKTNYARKDLKQVNRFDTNIYRFWYMYSFYIIILQRYLT